MASARYSGLVTVGITLIMTTVPSTFGQIDTSVDISGPFFDDDGSNLTSADLGELCDTAGGSANYSEVLIGSGESMVRQAASATGCPNHVNWNNPSPAREFPSNTSIPAHPVFVIGGGTTDLSRASGSVGILFNGVSAFSSSAKGPADSYETSAFYHEGDTLDLCGGQSTPEGWYHYNNVAGCLQEQAMKKAVITTAFHSPQLGWSYDGFPIYGQLGPDGVEMKLCGAEGADSTFCLDRCSGYEGRSNEDEFLYRYFTSCGFDESFFPFTPNCYRGCCPDGIECADHVQPCGTSTEAAFTEEYAPQAWDSMAQPYDADLIYGNDTDYIDSNSSVDCSLFAGSYVEENTNVPTPAPSFFGFSSSSSDMTGAPTSSPTSSPTGSHDMTLSPTEAIASRTGDGSGAGRISGPHLSATWLALAMGSTGVAIAASFVGTL